MKRKTKLKVSKLEYQLSQIKEHGLGDSDTEATKLTIQRELRKLKTK